LGGAILHKGETGAIQVRHEEHLYSNNYIKTKVYKCFGLGCLIVMVSSESSSGSLLEAAAQYAAKRMKQPI
jgi:hypothetical protein